MSDNEHDEDDKTTVVLDITALKKEMEQSKVVETDQLEETIEFSVTPQNVRAPFEDNNDQLVDFEDFEDFEEVANKKKIVLFNLNSDYFNKLCPKLPQNFDYTIVNELKELNQLLATKEQIIIVFNYNAAPKAINQLTTQINAKFTHVKTVIMAKGLASEKVQQHQSSKAGASAYIKVPFKISDFELTIRSL